MIIATEKYGNNGCNGGTFINSFKYVMDHTGIQSEQSYPYIAKVYAVVSYMCASNVQAHSPWLCGLEQK